MRALKEMADLWDPYGWLELHRYQLKGQMTWKLIVCAHGGQPRGPEHFDGDDIDDVVARAYDWIEAKIRAIKGVPKPSPA